MNEEFKYGMSVVAQVMRDQAAREQPLAARLRRCLRKRRARKAPLKSSENVIIPNWVYQNVYAVDSRTTKHDHTPLLGTVPSTVCTGPSILASILQRTC